MTLKECSVGMVAPVGVLLSAEGPRFDTSWGRFLDEVARRCRHVYTCGRRRGQTDAKIFTYVPRSNNISVEVLPPAKSSLHSLPQVCRLAVHFHRLIRDADLVFIRGLYPGWLFVWIHCVLRGVPICQQLPGNPLQLLRSHKRFSWWRQTGSVLYTRYAYQLLEIARRSPKFQLICNGAELAERFPGARTHTVISGSLYEDEFHIRSDTCTGARIAFGSVGLVRPEKGLAYLFEALAGFPMGKPWTLHIIGGLSDYPAEVNRLRAYASELRIADSIVWHGHVPFGRALFARLKALDVLVLPSLSEGTPRVLVEARAFGVPVVATNVGGIPTSIRDGEDGLLVPAHDSARLRDAIGRVVCEPELRRHLIRGGYRRARRLTLDRFADRVLNVMASQLRCGRR